jgi:acetylornithine/succinyldiaminopimelate/putrescine aminotransferase
MGKILHDELNTIKDEHADIIGRVQGKGLLAAMLFVKKGTKEPDHPLAFAVVEKCIQTGVMLYAPLGPGGGTVKVNPPLIITPEPLMEGISVVAEAIRAARKELKRYRRDGGYPPARRPRTMNVWFIKMLSLLRIGTGGYKSGAYKPD